MKNNNKIILLVIIILVALFGFFMFFVEENFKSNKLEIVDSEVKEDEVSNEVDNDNQSSEGKVVDNQSNVDINKVVDKLFNWTVSYVRGYGPYCGDHMKWDNEDDYISGAESYIHLYDVSQDFKTKEELNNYVKGYISDEVVNNYSKANYYGADAYREKDGKLYCLNPNKDHGIRIDKDKTTYRILESNDSEINAIGNVFYYEVGEAYPRFYIIPIRIVKTNGKWIVSSYANIETGLLRIDFVESYLNNIIKNNKLNPNHKISIEYSGKTYNSDAEIKSIVNIIKNERYVYTDVSNSKWIEPHIDYDNKGYITKIYF